MSSSRSSFFGFEIAKTGLFINQHNLNVTAHNISNVDTPGYTRQRLVTSAIEPFSSIGKLASLEHGLLGGGTRSHYIEQLRSQYLDTQYRKQNSTTNTWTARAQELEFIENIFLEPNNVGIMDMLVKDFFNSLSDLQTTSTNEAQREAVSTAAQKLAATLNAFYGQLTDIQSNQNKEIETNVAQVNLLADQVSELNKLIFAFELNGEHANDLRDQRNLLLDQLSSLVEIEVNEYKTTADAPSKLSVSIGSGASKGFLVDYDIVNHLDVRTAANRIHEDTVGAPNVADHPDNSVWVIMWDAGYSHPTLTPSDLDPALNANSLDAIVNIVGNGSIKGLLSLRDGDSNTSMGIPYFVHQLDQLARSIAVEFNKVQSKGYTMPRSANAGDPITGINFFDDYGGGVPDPTCSKVTAGNFKLDDLILKSVWNIACSDKEVISPNDPRLDPSDPSYVPGLTANEDNNLNTLKFLDILQSKFLPGISNIGDFYQTILVDIGTTASFSRSQMEANQMATTSVDVRRMSISAVSIDEEMTNLIKFQHAYAAASRVITTMDEALDKLINGTGVVGR